ncbi:unnamed protein product [Cylicocyclus nassatus]|uniref:Uncharacterized protein n=1 Tax=Cylicocyclus nassatus TaxID=53992 RepID=A0AA36HBM3_CYLNA|nr:unnamed protein product [Cylicocyclus nassatus]
MAFNRFESTKPFEFPTACFRKMRCCACLGLFLTCLLLLSCYSHARSTSDSSMQLVKRRMVIRVPFMQNPDSQQLSRIFHTSFTEQKRKKLYSGERFRENSEAFY